MPAIYRFAIVSALLAAAHGCGGGGSGGGATNVPGPPVYRYEVPADLGDGWSTASVSQVGIDESLITQGTNALLDGTYTGIEGLVIVKDGVLVHEAYPGNFTATSKHDLRSATKSLTSLLIGIAVDQQLITDSSEPALRYIQDYASYQNWDDRKNSIAIEHLLTMTSGLDCDDWTGSSPGNEARMYPRQDWVKFILDLPMKNDPGQQFSYCTGGVVALGAVIEGAAGAAADEFSAEHLFAPLGIGNYYWSYSPSGQVDTGGHIFMTPRDMAKVGQMVLDRGVWEGAQIVSDTWIDRSTAYRLSINNVDDYGYLWWRRNLGSNGDYPAVYASGNGGQYIFIIPDVNMVIVFTGGNYNSNLSGQPLEITDRYILRALTG